MNPASLARTLPRDHTFHPATLTGYKRRMNVPYGGHLYLNVVPREGSVVDGFLIPIEEHELEPLKRRESGYACIDITARLEEQIDGIAYTFIAPDVGYPDLKIKKSYIDRCLGGLHPERHQRWLEETIMENEIVEDAHDHA